MGEQRPVTISIAQFNAQDDDKAGNLAKAQHYLDLAGARGSNIAVLATGISRVVYALAYEKTENKIYWGDRNLGTIMRANPDGSDPEPWLVQEDSSPRGIAFGKKL